MLACAGLCFGLGIMASGCGGDGGSTVASPLAYPDYGTVTFRYTNLSANLGSVKYAFFDKEDMPVLVTDELPIEGESLSVRNVSSKATKVIGYYFNGGKATDFSIDDLSWNTTAAPYASVDADPTINEADLSSYRFKASPNHIDIGEQSCINLVASYLLSDKEYATLNLTPLASIEPVGALVMSGKDSLLNNVYQGDKYGKQEFYVESTVLNGFTNNNVDGNHDYVYVSDAVLSELILKDSVTEETEHVKVLHPNSDFGITPIKVGDDDCNVGSGDIFAIGRYVSSTDSSRDFEAKMTDEEVTWTTPNEPSLGFRLGNDRATYLARGEAENVLLSAYAYDPDNQKIGAVIDITTTEAEARAEYTVDSLVIDDVDYASNNWVPKGGDYNLNFKMQGYYVFDSGSTNKVQLFGNLGVGTVTPVISDDNIACEEDAESESYRINAGTAADGDTGTITMKVLDGEGKTVVSAPSYSYTVHQTE